MIVSLAGITAGLMVLALRLSPPFHRRSHRRVAGDESMVQELHRLKVAIQHVRDAVAVTDSLGQIQFVNPAFEDLTGYSGAAVLGLSYPLFLKEHHGKTMCNTLPDRMFQERSWEGELKHKNKHGNDVEGRVMISPVMGESGEILSYVVVKQDLTEQKKLESIAEAENLMNNSGYIFSSIRHEIANPLNSLRTTLDVLGRNSDAFSRDTILEFTRRAMAEVSRIEYLFDMFRNYNRFERPRGVPERIDWFIERFVSLVESDFSAKGIEIKADIPPGEHWGCMDPRALHQVMLNLFINAGDAVAGEDTPEIRVSLTPDGSCMAVSIEDNGCGMTKAEMATMFKPFCTSKARGTGIGLSIVKKMLSDLNCGIQVQSEKDRGTRVSIYIPQCPPSAEGKD